jgi:hypothetical protein
MPITMWRPIATAPKDGTPILVYGPESADFMPKMVTCAARYSESHASDGRIPWIAEGTEESLFHCHPTHWLPLPAPPAREE